MAQYFLLVTTDAGRTWTGPLSSPRIVGLVLASPTVGWAEVQGSSSSEIQLALTTDAGAHWSAVAIPPAQG